MDRCHIVGVGGTLRPQSSSEVALRVALRSAEAMGATVEAFAAADLDLPFYDPEDGARTDGAARMVDAFRRADGLVLASPGYHGAVSGMIKNALDYVEDLVADDRVYFADIPVGCIGVAYGSQAAVSVVAGLRTITHALRAFPTPYGAAVVSRRGLFDATGCTDPDVTAQLELVGRQVVEYSRATSRLPRGDALADGDQP